MGLNVALKIVNHTASCLHVCLCMHLCMSMYQYVYGSVYMRVKYEKVKLEAINRVMLFMDREMSN